MSNIFRFQEYFKVLQKEHLESEVLWQESFDCGEFTLPPSMHFLAFNNFHFFLKVQE